MIANTSEEIARIEVGQIGRIPVQNVWLLMFYASELFRSGSLANVAVEAAPDELPDLIAEFLCRAVEDILRRRLSVAYRPRRAVLGRVRGRIDALLTERHQLLNRGLVACRFEELTVDTQRNRFVRAALEAIAGIVRRRDLAHRCRLLAGEFRRIGVSGPAPTRSHVNAERLGCHDAKDRQMVAAAKLAFDFALPMESIGTVALRRPNREPIYLRRLFERAVGGFYDTVLTPEGWQIKRGKMLAWQISDCTSGIPKILPSMRTDIVLDHAPTNRRIVIDTKFTAIVTPGWHREESIRSGYLYQMYAYLHSQTGGHEVLARNATGLLLHPAVGDDLDETVVIQGHSIRFATVNLAAPTAMIRKRLLEVLGMQLKEE